MRHAPTAATRAAAFPADEPLDERGTAAAATLADRLPSLGSEPSGAADAPARPRCGLLCSPAVRCVQTAAAAGLGAPRVEPLLMECDFGTWAGRAFADVPEDDAGAWMTDPAAAPHGGEPLRAFAARVAGWLDAQARLDGRAVAITHGGVVKAAVVHALGAPLEAFWRIDVSPLSITELHAHDGRWTVTRVNSMADAPRSARSKRHAPAGGADGGPGGAVAGAGARS